MWVILRFEWFVRMDNECNPLMGEQQYGLLEAHYESGKYNVIVTLQDFRKGNRISIYGLVATPSNPDVSKHYLLEGGNQYRVAIATLASGWGYLFNYIP
ncbi:hypothetical protein EC604_11790 [Paenibacillus amylolyticus]|uniref:Uncharacterized protein n=2 Tax=Paenibacillus TaxID=44249 RepID=A0A5M9WSC1_PAEAM|nr:hypothetical protein [Paenibacillus amylolyticus]KAA8784526.1 hypothetical protein EC604_11790 [Paenibacillus amylolyticus]